MLHLSGFYLLSGDCLILEAEKCINTILIRKLAGNMQLTLIAWRRRGRSCYCCRIEMELTGKWKFGREWYGGYAISRRCNNNWQRGSVLGTISSSMPAPFASLVLTLEIIATLALALYPDSDPGMDGGLGYGGVVSVGPRCLLRQMPL